MSYPFFSLAATSKTASQHPCRFSKAAAVVAAPFLFINPAYAALNCTEQPTCTELGYSKADVEGCESYLYCPFDTNYKACTQIGETSDCSEYTLSQCPNYGICSSCTKDGNTTYKLDTCETCFSRIPINGGICSRNYQYDTCPTSAGAATCTSCTYSGGTVYNISTCKEGYTLNAAAANSRTCVANACSGYELNSCPTGGTCSTCLSGTTTKYKLDKCDTGYTMSGSTCVKNDCSDYKLTSCPDGGICSTCSDGSTTKYKVDSCENCFTYVSSTGHYINGSIVMAPGCMNNMHDQCPTGANCSQCEYSGGTLYTVESCKDGYILSTPTGGRKTCNAAPVVNIRYRTSTKKLTCDPTVEADNITGVYFNNGYIECDEKEHSWSYGAISSVKGFNVSETIDTCYVSGSIKSGSNVFDLSEEGSGTGCAYVKNRAVNFNYISY